MGRQSSPLDGRVIFLVGARRSGTQWLQRVLGTHPSIVTVPSETHLFSHGLVPLSERVQHGVPHSSRTGFVYMDRDDFLDGLRDFCDRLFGGLLEHLGQPDQMLLERTPWHVYALDLIGAVYPDAHVIHIIRDGRDVARSLVAQDWGPDTLEGAAAEWMSSVRAGRSSGKALERYVEVRYEDLMADPRTHVRALLIRLGIDDSDQVVDAALLEAEVQRNVDPTSRGVRPEKWRHELGSAELAAIEQIAGPLLEECGYPLAGGHRGLPPSRGRPAGTRHLVRAVGRRLRHPRRSQAAGQAERAVTAQLQASQQVVDRLLELIRSGSFSELAMITSPRVRVRLVEDETTWEGRGAEALARFERSVLADPARGTRQIRGETFPALPTTTVVSVHRLASGATLHRVLAVEVQAGVISGLTRFAGSGR